MEELIGLRLPTPVGVGCQRRIDLGRMSRLRFLNQGFDLGSGPPLTEAHCAFSLKIETDKVNSNPRTTFAVAGFQGRRRGLRDSRHEHAGKHGRNASEAAAAGAAEAPARGMKSSHTGSRRAKSRPLTRQVSDRSRSTCPE